MIDNKDQAKILMLYIFKEFDVEIDAGDAQASILATEEIPVLEYETCLGELIDAGHLMYYESEGKHYCGITELGKETIAELIEFIPKSTRELAIGRAIRQFKFIQSGKMYYHKYEACEDGGAYITCGLKDRKRTLMETRIYFADDAEAEQAYRTSKEKPEMVYNGLLTVITGKIDYLG